MTESEQIVYISCVEEVRYSFVSHLSEALRRKGINDLFVDSDDLLSEEAQAKVERARVAVIVLPGFLYKLDKVLKCQKIKDQVVVPVLYGFSSLQSDWLGALDLRGLTLVHQSRKDCTDSELVKEITKDVDEKLFNMERIGIDSKLLEIQSMVHKQLFGVRCVGIWGMPGIGKTTLAKAVFKQMSGDFDACCFIEDYDRAIHEKGLYRLLEEQFSKKKLGVGGFITRLSLLSNKLNNKRVLVVLDDVRNHLIAESLVGGTDWFGPESLIIITSRDKQVFRLCQVNHIYEVQGLNEKEAIQLFLLSASIKDKEEQNLHHELSMKVNEYAKGNPLAISIYGRELKGKKKLSEMETAFLELKRSPPFKIVDTFKSSYDTLNDSEKNIFLDIACFFNGENVNYVTQLLEGCGFFPHVGIDVLVEKRLVTISDNCVRMHNLVQDVGREIINAETVQIERRSRLWEPCIKYLLEDNEHNKKGEPKTTFKRAQGTKEIQGIFLDTSNLSFDVKPTAFENMLNLRLLKIYCSNCEIHPVINFPNGSLHTLPNELRLLHWENYPLRFLPPNFDPRRLVEINMPYSQLETLWVGTKNLEMLRTIRLCHSQQLVDVGDLSKAQNLEVVDLQGCTILQSFPATGQLVHLRVVNLSGCRAIKSFPEIPPNIETLHLQGTGIRKLPIVKPNGRELVSLSKLKGLSNALKLERLISLEKSSSSNQDLNKLICLELKDCSRLRSLPDMVSLELLKVLDLSGCSELKTIQGFPRNLEELYLAGTAVRHVPQLPQSLELFNAHGCVSLKSICLDSKKLPMHYTFSNCFDLSPYMVSKFLVEALASAKHIPRERRLELNRVPAFSFCSPSHADQNSTLGLQPGSSVMTRLNPSWRDTIVGFAMLVEVAFSEDYGDANGFGISCVCRWNNKDGRSRRIERNLHFWAPGKAVPKVQKDHIFVFVDVNMRPSTDEGNYPNILADLVVFEFFPVDKQNNRLGDSCAVTRCGVRVITGATCLEDISPAFSLDPMEVSADKLEEVLRASYRNLPNKDLFLYIACLFNDEDVDLVAPFVAGIELDAGLKVLADRSLISVSSNGEIVMHSLLQRMGKELLSEPMLRSSKKIERLVDNSQSSMINERKIDITHTENTENWTKDPCTVPITFVESNFVKLEMGEIDDGCCSTQLIDGNGEFNVEGLDNFVKKTKLSDCGLSYAVVAIMGPQSSGKSTLLNHLFKTSFREMDAFAGRSQTTKGIWMARCVGIEPFTVAMDLEGTDGRERGEDDTTFEKQSALFALAVADIVLINMWCHDIGREHASNKPLLNTVFQVMMQLFSPRKTTLLFVIRDKTKTPVEMLDTSLREDIQKIWDLVRKPEAHKNTPLSEFFNVEIVALSNYEEKEKLFKEELAELRQRFFHSISPGGLAGDRRGVVPASGFSFSSRQIWKVIKENRDLDLPAHKVMVATVRCEQIANEKLQNLATDENLLELQEAVQSGPVPGFGKKLSSILEKYFSEYDAEAVYFEEGVRKEKRLQMKIKALDFVYSAYATMLGHLRSSALESFKIRLEQSLNQGEGFAKAVRDSQQSCLIMFDKGCEDATVEQATWNASKIREKLCRDIDSHTSSTRTAKLSELTANYEKRLIQALSGPVESLFETGGKETWPSIRKLLKRETETAVTDFLDVVTGFELDHATIDSMVQNLKDYSQGLVEKKAREEAAKILIRMKDRFSTVFSHDKDSMPRVWTGKEDIRANTKDARAEALSLLAVMAAIRLDERSDNIESTLFSSLMDGTVSVATSHNRSLGTSTDPLASTTWEEVPPKDVLLTPVQCKSLWRQFKSETEYTVTQAISAQEAHKRNNNWLPPAWAIVLMIVLGFNEFMMLLKNPLYLLGFFVAFLLSKALLVQLDIPREFQHGALAGVLSITSKFLPTVMNLLRKLAEEAQGKTTQGAPEYSATQSYKQQSPSPSISSTVAESVSSNISQMADDDAEYSSRPALVQRRNTSNVQESEISQI